MTHNAKSQHKMPAAKGKPAPMAGKSMGGTSDGHMVANPFMAKAGDKHPKSKGAGHKKGY